jgi:hypothetical protein
MVPFLVSLAFFFLLNTKQHSKTGFIEIVKDLFFHFFIIFIIIILMTGMFLLLGYYDLSLIDTIYCDGGDDSDYGNSQPTKLESAGTSTNIPSNSPDTNTETNSRKIELDKEKYYHVRKDSVDKVVELVDKGVERGVEKAVANLGVAAAAGSAASTILKSNLPIIPKIAAAGVTAVVVGASTKIGIGEAILNKSRENPSTDVLNKIVPDRVPSPSEFLMSSVLETPELVSPLEELIRYQFILNLLILFSVLILIFILFNKLFLSNNYFISFITRFLNKDTVLKFDYYRIRIEKFNNSFFFLLFVINAITLLFNIFLSLVISYELTFDLDYYTSAHNGIKYSFLYLITMYRGLGYSELKAKEKKC